MTAGRPLRFLLIVLLGWAGYRIAQHRPEGAAVRWDGKAIASTPRSAAPLPWRVPARSDGVTTGALSASTLPAEAAAGPGPQPLRIAAAKPGIHPVPPARLVVTDAASVIGAPPAEPRAPYHLPAAPIPSFPDARTTPDRLAGSTWLLIRGGGAAPFAGGRLGGAQAGVRLTYALDEGRRVALAARASSPLRGRGREGAVGLDWRPTRLPVHVVAEHRFALDGDARTGPALFLVGGLDPRPVAPGLRLEGYAQAGVAAGAFADGAVRLAGPVARAGGLRLDLGVGAWGGAQRGAARLDVGPGASLVVPLAGRAVRLTLDYRYRAAGRADPGSGPVLTLGSDF